MDNLYTKLKGKSILQVDLKKIASEIGKYPNIQKVEVERNFPGEIGINIKDRKPVALLQWSESSPFGLMSEDGAILDVFPRGESDKVIVEAFDIGIKKISVGLQLHQEALFQAIQLIKEYQKSRFSQDEKLTRVVIDKYKNIAIMLGNGPVIRLGRRPVERLKHLEKALPLLKGQDRMEIEYIDLQFDDMVIKRKGENHYAK